MCQQIWIGFLPMMFLNFARHMFMHFSCISIFSFLFFVSGCDVFCSLFLSWIDYAMAPKARKSTPARNHFPGSGPSSSDHVPPLHVQFCDEKAQKDFLENFQKRGVHPERQVILSDFTHTSLPFVIQTWGWESLFKRPMRCPIMFMQEFYSNIHGIDTSVSCFAITF